MGIACTRANAPTMSAACSVGSRRSASASKGAGRTRRETTNLEYALGEMNKLADESMGTSVACSLAAAPGKGQRDAKRFTSSSGVGLSMTSYDDAAFKRQQNLGAACTTSC